MCAEYNFEILQAGLIVCLAHEVIGQALFPAHMPIEALADHRCHVYRLAWLASASPATDVDKLHEVQQERSSIASCSTGLVSP